MRDAYDYLRTTRPAARFMVLVTATAGAGSRTAPARVLPPPALGSGAVPLPLRQCDGARRRRWPACSSEALVLPAGGRPHGWEWCLVADSESDDVHGPPHVSELLGWEERLAGA
jgi:hypothetical protein